MTVSIETQQGQLVQSFPVIKNKITAEYVRKPINNNLARQGMFGFLVARKIGAPIHDILEFPEGRKTGMLRDRTEDRFLHGLNYS